VYRTLKLFKELGLVDEMRLDKVRCYYEIRQSPGHQHLVCQGCQKIMEIESPHFHQLIEAIRYEHGFNITKAQLFLEGYCPECEVKKGEDDVADLDDINPVSFYSGV